MKKLIVFCLALSLKIFSAEFVYLVNGDGTVTVINSATLTEIAGSPFAGVPSIGMGNSVAIAISPDQTRAYLAGWQRSDYVAVFDIEEDGALTLIAPPFNIPGGAPFGVAVSADNTRVYVTCPGLNEVQVYDADFTTLIATTGALTGSPHPIVLSPLDGSVFVAYTDMSEVVKFDSNLNLVAGPVDSSSMSMMGTPYGIALNPAGTLVYAANASISELDCFNASDLTFRGRGTTDLSGPIGMAFSSDGSIIYVGNTGGSNVAVLDAAHVDGMLEFDFPQLHVPLATAGFNCYITALSPDGTRLYATDYNDSMAMPFPPLTVFDVANNYMTIANSLIAPAPQFGIAFATPGPAFPGSLSGVQKKNDFGLFYEYYNVLSWTSPLNFPVAGYYVYRNGERIATLGPAALSYDEHARPPGTAATYTVTAFDSGGFESDPATVVVP